MPTEPAEIPKWADTETPATPSGGQQNAGWSTIPIPSYDTFDWLGKWTGRWITWLKAWYAVDHNSDGNHTSVRVMTRLFIESTASIVYQLGVGAPSSRVLNIPLGSYDKGGWVVLATTGAALVINDAATPPNTGMGATAATLRMMTPIPLVAGPDDSAAGDQWTIDDLKITYKRVATASNAYAWKLRSMLADGTGAYVDEASGTLSSATITRATVTCAEDVIASRRYFAEITMTHGAGAAAGEVVTANVDASCQRRHLE